MIESAPFSICTDNFCASQVVIMTIKIYFRKFQKTYRNRMCPSCAQNQQIFCDVKLQSRIQVGPK